MSGSNTLWPDYFGYSTQGAFSVLILYLPIERCLALHGILIWQCGTAMCWNHSTITIQQLQYTVGWPYKWDSRSQWLRVGCHNLGPPRLPGGMCRLKPAQGLCFLLRSCCWLLSFYPPCWAEPPFPSPPRGWLAQGHIHSSPGVIGAVQQQTSAWHQIYHPLVGTRLTE